MIVTVFRNRLNPEAADEYYPMAEKMSEEAQKIPGYIAHKTFAAEDGERVTILEHESMDAVQLWSKHAGHMEAKKKGRDSFYDEYSIQVCEVIRSNKKSK